MGNPAAVFGRVKAAKNDDAIIDVGYWDAHVVAPWSKDLDFDVKVQSFREIYDRQPTDSIRKLALREWNHLVWKSLRRFLRKTYSPDWPAQRLEEQSPKLERTLMAARDCLRCCEYSDWWEWMVGSRLLFWSWPLESQKWARDGLPIYLLGQPTDYRKPQPRERDPAVAMVVRTKFDKFRSKGYVAKGRVEGLTSFFTAPKGDGDIRLVFDGTKSGLISTIWAPSFTLPLVNSLLTALEPGTWMADINIAEQFYNFLLDPAVRPFCGVDLSPYYPGTTSWERWER